MSKSATTQKREERTFAEISRAGGPFEESTAVGRGGFKVAPTEVSAAKASEAAADGVESRRTGGARGGDELVEEAEAAVAVESLAV